jgi:lysophospholipase L1-like esterase
LKKIKYLFLGDSLIEYNDWHRFHPQINAGIAGDRSSGVLRRLKAAVSYEPETIVLMVGINDLLNHVPIEEIEKNYSLILDSIPSSISVCIMSLLPTGGIYASGRIRKNIVEVNDFLKMQAAKRALCFLNLYSHFVDDDGNIESIYTTDGVHLNPKGYELWERLLEKRLR